MQDFGTKADNSPPPGGQLSAAEFNNLAAENENAVLHSGQALSGASDTQLAQSLFLHGVKSESFQDSGAANAYVATPSSGASGVLLPADYAAMHGSTISFKASNANTGASTLNIGQTTGTLIGAKAIVDQSGVALVAGAIPAGIIQLRYDSSIGAGSWVLLPWSANSGRLINVQVFTATGVYTPTSGTVSVIVEVQGAGGGGGGTAITAAGQVAAAYGGTGGTYAKGRFSSAFSGVTVSIGAGGLAATAGNNPGGSGGASSFGALLSCPGGVGGIGGSANAAANSFAISNPPSGAPSGTSLYSSLGAGSFGPYTLSTTQSISGEGGMSYFGIGARPRQGGAGFTADNRGAGGSGAAVSVSSGVGQPGGAGADGIVIVWEYAQ